MSAPLALPAAWTWDTAATGGCYKAHFQLNKPEPDARFLNLTPLYTAQPASAPVEFPIVAWILVSERLPRDGEAVLISRPVTGGKETFNVVDFVMFLGGEWRKGYKTLKECGYWDEVTHWMPLPEAPPVPQGKPS